MCAEMKSFQVVFWLRLGAVPLQDVSDRLAGDLVAEVGQCAGDPIVSPAGVLLGHAEDEGFDCRIDARASRIGTMLGSVELAGNQRRYQARIVSGLAIHATCARC
jgi:hypothetical protein